MATPVQRGTILPNRPLEVRRLIYVTTRIGKCGTHLSICTVGNSGCVDENDMDWEIYGSMQIECLHDV